MVTAQRRAGRTTVRGRRRLLVTATAGLLGCLLLGVPNPGLAAPPEPTAITGSDSVVGAPSLAPGRWVDSIGPGTAATKHYVIDRRYPGSTLVVSAATPATGANYDPPSVSFDEPDGSSCYTHSGSAWEQGAQLAIAHASSGSVRSTGIDPESGCVTQTRMLVTISSPDELPAQPTPMQITVTEIPAARQAAALPQTPDDITWQAPPDDSSGDQVTGGSGAEPGPVLGHGTYESAISPGQKLRYQVRADWGQQLSTTTSLTANVPTGATGPKVETTILGPNGASAEVTGSGGPPGSRTLFGDSTIQVGAQTAPVLYRNLAGSGGAFGASQPGTYTIVVSMSESTDVTGPIPFLLQVGVHGGRSGVPEFAAGQQIDTGGYDDPDVGAAAAGQEGTGQGGDGQGGDGQSGDGTDGTRDEARGDAPAGDSGEQAGTVLGMPRWLLVGALGLVGAVAILAGVLVALAARRPRR